MKNNAPLNNIAALNLAKRMIYGYTNKEIEGKRSKILEGMLKGDTYEDIARSLGISTEVVSSHHGKYLLQTLKSTIGDEVKKNTLPRMIRSLEFNHDIPCEYIVDSEKNFAMLYENKELTENVTLELSCYAPKQWPEVSTIDEKKSFLNPIDEKICGRFKSNDSRIRALAKTNHSNHDVSFLEARPRKLIKFPKEGKRDLNVAILVSGGNAPGINSIIGGLVNRHYLYSEKSAKQDDRAYTLKIIGFQQGFRGLLLNNPPIKELNLEIIQNSSHESSSIIGLSRAPELLSLNIKEKDESFEKILRELNRRNIDILYIIGGDGSMKAAHEIAIRSKESTYPTVSVIAIPKTMDNDILWVWQSFGFLSVVEASRDIIIQLRRDALLDPRLYIVQLFGSDSGFVAAHTALSSNSCDCVLIPESPFSIDIVSDEIINLLKRRLSRNISPSGLIIMSETAIPTDYSKFIKESYLQLTVKEIAAIEKYAYNGRRVYGKVPKELRSGALKLVFGVIQNKLNEASKENSYWKGYPVVTNEPKHIIRSVKPTVSDIIFGERLGILAVDNAMAGYTDFMISNWLTEYVLVPLKLVILGRKRVFPEGIFWKSVLSSTEHGRNVFGDK